MRKWIALIAITGFILSSCGKSEPSGWNELIPAQAPFLIIAEENSTLNEMLNAPYIPLFEDISTSAIQVTGQLLEHSEVEIPLHAILIYPDTANDWQPVWITGKVDGLTGLLTNHFQRPFTQNRYHFHNYTIDKLFIENRVFYITDLGSYTLVSESSMAIEAMIRALNGQVPRLELTQDQKEPGSFVFNMPNMERWVEQVAQVSYRPELIGSFEGSSPLAMAMQENNPDESVIWSMAGQMLTAEDSSPLIRSISAPSRNLQLDRYISANSAAFSIFQMEPRMVPPQGDDPLSELDQYLSENTDIYRELASALTSETAFAAFAESGFMSSSEFMLLRGVEDPGQFRRIIENLASEDLLQKDDDTYMVHSPWLGNLIGSDLSTMTNFWLGIHGNAIAISRSKGLVEAVGTDFNRRQVIYYEDHYIDIRESLPSEVSSFTYVDTPVFNSYIQPWLHPQNYFGALSSNLELFTITTSRASESDPLDVIISSRERETTDVPYRERWIYPLASETTGPAVLADISGNSRNELVFAAENSTVYVLSADGSVVTQASTNGDTPLGSPVVYDWYGNNQNVIMQVAGNKIYAWNEAGTPLPNFPIQLSEVITTPLQVEDVTRNGVAEIIVATADRNVHILDSRGENISGWPQTANSVISAKPVITPLDEQRSLFAFAENGLHSWDINGERRQGFPIFIESRFNGSPYIHDNYIFGSASNGNLYVTGTRELFADTLAASTSGDSLITQSLNISNSSLNTTPGLYNEMIRVDEDLVREDLILLQSSNGSVFLVNTEGQLRFSQNMGQPGSEDFSPVITDLNSNNRRDIVALADFGRLYAWDLISGNRIYDLPTSGMRYPLLSDLNNDGNNEILAYTRDGFRIWTIFRSDRSDFELQQVSD